MPWDPFRSKPTSLLAYLLADVVVAIPAVDLAVEAVVRECRCVLPCIRSLSHFNWLPCIPPKHAWFSVHMCALFQSES